MQTMKLTCCRRTALFITRAIRIGLTRRTMRTRRCELIAPDPSPRIRWTQSALDFSKIGLDLTVGNAHVLDVAIPSKEHRMRMRHSRNIMYGSESRLPPHPFIEIAPGLAISCPELLFMEMASVMTAVEHLMLGYELCGSFARDPFDPLNGPVKLGCKPLTTTAKLAAFLKRTRWIRGGEQAERTISCLSDNAWSPTEAVVATMASLPFDEFGYQLGPCLLNERIDTPSALARVTEAKSRVPDILFPDTPAGINYDGAVHLDLDSVINAAMELERNPGQTGVQDALDRIVREVRAKVVDDIRRNRELAADGYIVFPVTKEDLYEEGGLDRVMLQIIETVEKFSERDMRKHRSIINAEFARAARQELIWSLLPGKHPENATRVPPPISGPRITEITVGF